MIKMTINFKDMVRLAEQAITMKGTVLQNTKVVSERLGIEALKMARIMCPVGDTGRLKRSLWRGASENIFEFHKFEGMTTVEVGTKVPYAAAVEYGITNPYFIPTGGIMPEGKFLRWENESGVHFSKGVVHPSMTGKGFLEQATIFANLMVFDEMESFL